MKEDGNHWRRSEREEGWRDWEKEQSRNQKREKGEFERVRQIGFGLGSSICEWLLYRFEIVLIYVLCWLCFGKLVGLYCGCLTAWLTYNLWLFHLGTVMLLFRVVKKSFCGNCVHEQWHYFSVFVVVWIIFVEIIWWWSCLYLWEFWKHEACFGTTYPRQNPAPVFWFIFWSLAHSWKYGSV